MQVVVECMEPGQLVLFPQIMAACIALLPLNLVQLAALVIELLSKVCSPCGQTSHVMQPEQPGMLTPTCIATRLLVSCWMSPSLQASQEAAAWI